MSESDELTELGGLQFHLAAAACYLPLMYIHLIASGLFLLREPREHRLVRFHASQSLLITAGWIVSSVVFLLLMVVTPFAFIAVGAMLSSLSEDLAAVMLLLGIGGQVLFAALAILAAFVGPVALFAMTLFSAMEKDVRLPLLAGLADRLAGSPA